MGRLLKLISTYVLFLQRFLIVAVLYDPHSSLLKIKYPYFQNAHAYVNAGFVAKLDKNTMALKNVRIVYAGITPFSVRTFFITFDWRTRLTFWQIMTNKAVKEAFTKWSRR